MEQFLISLWESIYYTTIDLFNFILYQAWLAIGMLVLLAAAKIVEWKFKIKKDYHEKK